MEQARTYSFRKLMNLECLDEEAGIYQGINTPAVGEYNRVYGGHLLAQALMAAFHTVPEDRLAHNLHAYFIRPGDMNLKNELRVARTRDGRSYSARQVDVVQQDKIITSLDISFCTREDGLSHQIDMPAAPDPESLPDSEAQKQRFADAAQAAGVELGERGSDLVDELLETRQTRWINYFEHETGEPRTQEWLRLREDLGENPRLHQCAFTYLSDFSLMDMAFCPHGVSWMDEEVQSVSLDHAVWFHKGFRADDWLLMVQESPVASGGRGFNRGTIFSRDGDLVASLAQEGLMRIPQNMREKLS